jgi:hypothetical protein
MPFKGGKRQMRAMFAKGGKSAKVARQWAHTYGVPKSETGRKKKGQS